MLYCLISAFNDNAVGKPIHLQSDKYPQTILLWPQRLGTTVLRMQQQWVATLLLLSCDDVTHKSKAKEADGIKRVWWVRGINTMRSCAWESYGGKFEKARKNVLHRLKYVLWRCNDIDATLSSRKYQSWSEVFLKWSEDDETFVIHQHLVEFQWI